MRVLLSIAEYIIGKYPGMKDLLQLNNGALKARFKDIFPRASFPPSKISMIMKFLDLVPDDGEFCLLQDSFLQSS